MNSKSVLPSFRSRRLWLPLALVLLAMAWPVNEVRGTDYFLTIGGGYEPAGNQASLEANVLFFQDVLQEKHTGGRTQATFFADGCWDEQAISALEFESWLDEVPETVPVVMIMAQCYCGGFAHTIFEAADRQQGLAKQPRVGFFAQQHDLPAAGCRPDIENDEEYSSWIGSGAVQLVRLESLTTEFRLGGARGSRGLWQRWNL